MTETQDAAARRLSDTLALLEPRAGPLAADALDFVVVDAEGAADTEGAAAARACAQRLLGSADPFGDSSVLEYRRLLFAHGCPSRLRGVLWRLLLGYLPAHALQTSATPATATAAAAEEPRPRTPDDLAAAVDRVLAPRRA